MHCFNSSVFIAISLLTLCGALVDATGDCLVSTSVVSVCVVVCVCISHCSVIIKIIFMCWYFFDYASMLTQQHRLHGLAPWI